ncbi:MAG: bifunctional lysylphosphatidylglycerol flippase/synthetase MprF [Deltaproteobacteria bacterium]|nr:bifunctional lysylphosphatidylglycerol flippase/synthetase MprF [Deltaproteobacteria bacterium]
MPSSEVDADASSASGARLRERLEPYRPWLGSAFGIALFGAALWVLHHELRAYSYTEVIAALRGLPRSRLALGLACTAASYLLLTGYDALACRYLAHALRYRQIALASFVGYAFSHNVGASFLGGGAIRYRLYSSWGLQAGEIATIVAFNGITFWLGFLLLTGGALLFEPAAALSAHTFPAGTEPAIGVVCLGIVAAYVGWSALRRTPLRIRAFELRIPPLDLTFVQLTLSTLDWALAASVLYVVLPPSPTLGFPAFLAAFLLAQVAGLASHLPAGLGVFETVILVGLAPYLPGPAVLGSLVAYRVIYYLVPLLAAGALLGAHELWRRTVVRRVGGLFGRIVPEIVPQALAVTTFLGGGVLLASGATPAIHGRLGWLQTFLPLPVLETSHFFGSLTGVGLLLLARGLQHRLDAAYLGTVALLAVGIVFSLLKGFDYEEAIILTVMLAALLPCRKHFYRRASLLDESFTAGWSLAIALVVLGSLWLLLLSHRHVDYSSQLWWQFEFGGNAPRALRATTAASVVLMATGLARLLRPAPPRSPTPSPADLDRAAAVTAAAPRTYAHLALLGDKTLLFRDDAHGSPRAFIMYGVAGRSWVAFGDPVGPPEDARELAWRFRELSDAHVGWTVFYEVGPENLPLYLDLGLSLLKLGEEARVPLTTFGLEGSARKSLRQTHRRVEKEAVTFALLPAEEVPALLPDLRRVSDAWLAEKSTREKGFSLGFFSPDYLRRGPVAVARRGERLVAFANVLLGGGREEISVDLMRYEPATAPPGVMDYLFLELMLWGRDAGYRWFGLGMAPFSGFDVRTLAPLWSRAGAFLFRQGEHFYNFQGVRKYKDKFDPVWEPRYLASPGGLALPRILTNVAALVSGGLTGVMRK